MNLKYNNFIENTLTLKLVDLINGSLIKNKFGEVLSIVFNFENKDITHYIENKTSCNYTGTITYRNDRRNGEVMTLTFMIPRMVNDSFVIRGSMRIPILNLINDYKIRFQQKSFKVDKYRRFDYPSDTFHFKDDNGWNQVNVDDLGTIDSTYLELDEESKIKLAIKLNTNVYYDKLTPSLLKSIKSSYQGYSDILEDFVLDKRIMVVQESLLEHILDKETKKEFYTSMNSKFRSSKTSRIYANDLEKIFNNFFNMRSKSFLSIQSPTKVNALNFSALAGKIVVPQEGPNSTHYNKSLTDLIDPIRTPEGNNVNRLNEINVCIDIDENGLTFIKIYDKYIKSISIPYYKYYDSYVISNKSFDYRLKSIIEDTDDKIEVRHRDKTLKLTIDELESVSKLEYYIDCKPDDKLSVSTRNIPMVNSTDSVRSGMGANMINQAVELLYPDKPVVATGNFDGENSPLNVYSMKAGVVEYMDDSIIRVSNDDNTISEYTSPAINSINRINITRVHQVKVGDRVEANQAISKPRIADGGFNLGVNLRCAYLAYGNTYEDGYIISSSVVEKLAHVSIHDFEILIPPTGLLFGIKPIGDSVIHNDILVNSSKPMNRNRMKKIDKILNNLDTTDISNFVEHYLKVPPDLQISYISDCQVVVKDDANLSTAENDVIGAFRRDYRINRDKVKKVLPASYTSQVLGDDFDKERNYKVLIRVRLLCINKIKPADKLSNRYGAKGLVAQIIPEELMPYDENGDRVEVILNPASLIARKNVSQLLEMSLNQISVELFNLMDSMIYEERHFSYCRDLISRIANPDLFQSTYEELVAYHKSCLNDKRYTIITGAYSDGMMDKVKEYNKLLGINESGIELYDGYRKKKMRNRILVGSMYIIKLYHLSEFKNQVTSDNMMGSTPVLGGHFRTSGQKMGEQELVAFLSNDLPDLVKEYRGDTEISDQSMLLSNFLVLGLDVVTGDNNDHLSIGIADSNKKLKDKFTNL